MVRFSPASGQIVLLEGAASGAVPGVVVRGRPLTVDTRDGALREGEEVRVTICGGGDRWVGRGLPSVLSPGRVVIDPVVDLLRHDRRGAPRRRVRVGVTLMGGDSPDGARSVDVSSGGLRIVASHRMAAGTRTTVILPLPGGAPIMAPAEVLAVEEAGDAWSCRLRFDQLRVADARRLALFVADRDHDDEPDRRSRARD